MWPFLNALFGKNRRGIIANADTDAGKLLADLYEYYSKFAKKIELLATIKSLIVDAKARIYDTQQKAPKNISPETIEDVRRALNAALIKLIEELAEAARLIDTEESIEQDATTRTEHLLSVIDNELNKEYTVNQQLIAKYHERMQSLRAVLVGEKANGVGIHHVLVAQRALLNDLRKEKQSLDDELTRNEQHPDVMLEHTLRLLRLLEVEVLRFGTYCAHESQLLNARQNVKVSLETAMQTMKALGLVYSEREITQDNIRFISLPLNHIGPGLYGAKGIGIVHHDGSVEFRFVKGRAEKHSQVVKMLFEGMSGKKLNDDLAIRNYLKALPVETISKIAGYELQLQCDEQGNMKVINIDFASTILNVQVERKELHAEPVQISRQDLNRLNYALLFSIDKNILDKKKFSEKIAAGKGKITITDTRIVGA